MAKIKNGLDFEDLESKVIQHDTWKSQIGKALENPNEPMTKKWMGEHLAYGDKTFYLGKPIDLYLSDMLTTGAKVVKDKRKELIDYATENERNLIDTLSTKDIYGLAIKTDAGFSKMGEVLEKGDTEAMIKALKPYHDEDVLKVYSENFSETLTRRYQSHMRIEELKKQKELLNKEGTDLSREKVESYLKENLDKAKSGIKEEAYIAIARAAYGALKAEEKDE